MATSQMNRVTMVPGTSVKKVEMKTTDQCSSSHTRVVGNGQVLVMGTETDEQQKGRHKMTRYDKQVRPLVRETLKVYEGLVEARKIVRELYPESDWPIIKDPRIEVLSGKDDTMLLAAIDWVSRTGFRSMNDGESGREWLRAYLAEPQTDHESRIGHLITMVEEGNLTGYLPSHIFTELIQEIGCMGLSMNDRWEYTRTIIDALDECLVDDLKALLRRLTSA